MSDDELAKYMPLHGERLRVRQYVRSHNTPKNRGKHTSLLKILREKIETKRNPTRESNRKSDVTDEDMRESKKRFGNRNAAKEKRKVKLGWIHRTSERSIQVRSKKGGGTRKLTLRKDTNKQALLQEGKKLFFPNGRSPHGSLHEFDFDICGYQDRSMDEKVQPLVQCTTKQSCLYSDFI